MLAYHMARGQSIEKRINLGFSVTDLKKHLKSGVLSLCTATGLMVFYSLMEEEVTSLVGPKGKHDPNREAYRHGTERSSIVPAGQKIPITRPRVRSIDGRELPIESFEMVRSEDPLCEVALARMLHGLSSRNYQYGSDFPGKTSGPGKSTVSRRFIEATKAELKKLLTREVPEIVVLLVDGVQFGNHNVIVAMGIGIDGRKHILGLRVGATTLLTPTGQRYEQRDRTYPQKIQPHIPNL